MVRRLLVFTLLLVAVVLAGCVMPTKGAVFAPVMVTKSPVLVGDGSVGYSKVGEAMSEGIIFVAVGDSSIKAAMEDADITRIHHVDSEELNVLGIYCRHITRVYGD